LILRSQGDKPLALELLKKLYNMPTSKKTSTRKSGGNGRAKVAIPKAGVTRTHRRYGCGGKIK